MFLKKKYIQYIIYAALGFVVLYTGITFVATLTKAITQPHLESNGVRYDFLGFYMLSSTYGGICLLAIVVLVVLIIMFRKMNKETK